MIGDFNAPEGFKENLVVTALKTDKPYGQYVGSFELQDCADVCRDREDCFAFSSCLVGKQCVIATGGPKARVRRDRVPGGLHHVHEVVRDELRRAAGHMLLVRGDQVRGRQPRLGVRRRVHEREGVHVQGVRLLRDPARGGDCPAASRTGASCRSDNAKDLDRSGAEKCSHFTRKHISDYRKERRVRLLGTPRTTIKKVSEAECARQCWEATFRCERFDHCSGKNELGKGDCLLFDGDKGTDGTVMSPICNSYTYTGQYNDPVARAPQAFHSNAKAAGLSFFVVFLGVGIALAALFAYGIYKTRRASPQE
ncbi:hypothetical protein MRX96_042383 [Rhipicephalus microplus]